MNNQREKGNRALLITIIIGLIIILGVNLFFVYVIKNEMRYQDVIIATYGHNVKLQLEEIEKLRGEVKKLRDVIHDKKSEELNSQVKEVENGNK